MKIDKFIYLSVIITLFMTVFNHESKAYIYPPFGPVVPVEPEEPDHPCEGYIEWENIYCSNAQISSGLCGEDAIGYDIDSETGAFVIGEQYYSSMNDIVENNGMSREEYIAYLEGDSIDEEDNPFSSSTGTNSPSEQPRAKRTYYTPAEAAQHVHKGNNNTITFTFK